MSQKLAWGRIKDAFFAYLDIPAAERAGFLDSFAENHAELSAELMALIASHEKAEEAELAEQPVLKAPSRILSQVLEEAPPEFQDGEVIQDFRILRELGRGAMGRVYLAQDLKLDRQVALKLCKGSVRDEARTLAALDHPRIVRVFSESHWETAHVLCMQYVPGPNLAEVLASLKKTDPKPRSFIDAIDAVGYEHTVDHPEGGKRREHLAKLSLFEGILESLLDLLQALRFAHEQGILHLDLKPANILLDVYGTVYLTDFNVSLRMPSQGRTEGLMGYLGGTRTFMAPEQEALFHLPPHAQRSQLQGLSPAADVFGLARVAQEMVEAAGPAEASVEWLEEWRDFLSKALDPDPKLRIADAREFEIRLRLLRDRYQISRRLLPLGRGFGWIRSHSLGALVISILLPQALGSAVNISYNYAEIISELGPLHRETFSWVCLLYNLIFVPVALGVLLWSIWPFLRPRGLDPSARFRALIRLPRRIGWGTLLGWVPGILFFPALWRLGSGQAMSLHDWGHLVVSFLLSWWVALSHSMLLSTWVTLEALLYRYWCVRETQATDLDSLERIARRWPLWAGLIPILAALLILWGREQTEGVLSGQALLSLLLIMGGVGLLFSEVLRERMLRTIQIYKKNLTSKKI